MTPRGFAALATVLAAALASAAAAASPSGPLPIECDPSYGGAATDSYQDSEGGWFIGDAFPDCISPAFWNGLGWVDDEGPITHADEAAITSDGSSVTARVSLELGLPEGSWAQLSASADARGRFRAPGNRSTPATLVFEIERTGAIEGLSGGPHGYVRGPGVELFPSLRDLPDGTHRFDEVLKPRATYEVGLSAGGELSGTGSGSQRVTFQVLAPEPGGPLLVLVGATLLALRRAIWS